MRALLTATLLLICLPVHAADYYNQKWFDYPDPGTLPRTTTTCAHEACTDIPEFHGFHVSMVRHCICTNPIVHAELLRKDVKVVVSGPDSPDAAVRNALMGYAAGCVAAAIAASTAGPQIVASPAGFFASFKACILGLSVAGVAG